MIAPSLRATSARNLRVVLTGEQAYQMTKVLKVYEEEPWRPADFIVKLKEVIFRLWKFHYDAGRDRLQPDNPKPFFLPEWQALFIVNAFEEWLLEYGRYRKAGTKGAPKDWQPDRIAKAFGWTADNTILGVKTKIATEAVQLFKTAELV